MANRSIVPVLVCLLLAGSMLLAGCGGVEETSVASVPSGPSGPVSFLAWDPPQTYEDSSPLDPYLDLDYYEFFIRADMNFTDNDLPVAQVAACVDILSPDGHVYLPSLTTDFDLENLMPFVPPGLSGYLSIRAVGMNGQKSDFSQPIYWNLNQLS
ncbi:MAG: hypothetical protein WBX49_00530 [Candidatus Deferrimicrobiaceae bacterium]